MRLSLISCLAILPLVACSAPAAPPEADTATEAAPEPAVEVASAPALPKLEQLWVAEGFEDPEGAALAPDGNYFISNVRGEGGEKDGDGYVSKVSTDGNVLERYFAAKLNEPKGMAVKDGILYVADIDEIVKFDANTGARLGGLRVPDAQFLNDMTVWNGKVLVSDSGTAEIIDVTGETPVVWLKDEANLAGINGILGDGDRLLVATMSSGALYSVSESGELTELARGMENADGIGIVPGGGYLVSSWPGQIHYAPGDGTFATLSDTVEAGIMQNDLSMFGDIVISPNWVPGTVTAYRVVR